MSDTLKDFLVGVGFRLDEVSQRQTDDAIARTEERATAKAKAETKKRAAIERAAITAREKARREADARRDALDKKAVGIAQSFALKMAVFAAKTATAASAAVAGVLVGVDKAAQGFDRLTYVAKLAGASVASVTAFGYAAGQLGSSPAEAEAALDSFGRKLRTNGSAYAKVLGDLGVKTQDAAGHFRDSAEIATDLGDALRKIEGRGRYGYSNAINQGAVFGFDENLVRALMNPAFRGREGQQKADQARIGADPNSAAAGGTAYEQSMRRLRAIVDDVGVRINDVLFVKLKPLLDQISAWFLANGSRIADIVSRLAVDLVRLASAIAQQLAGADWDKILDSVEALSKRLGALLGHLSGEQGLVLAIGAFALALRGLAVIAMPPWLLAILGVTAAAMALGVGRARAEPAGAGRNGTSGGAGGGEQHGRRGFGARMATAARKLTGVDALRARGRKAKEARQAADDVPAGPLPEGLKGQRIVGGANLMSGGQYPGAAPGKDLVTITTASGKRLTVHRDAAPSFKRFVDQLEARGYKINSLGGYANRANRSNSGRPSEHAFGNAIDINPERNPFRSDQTDMPSDVSKLAAENGLSWGGDWRHKDNMHFEWRGVRPWVKGGNEAPKVGEKPTPEDLTRSNEDAYRSKQNPFLRRKDVPVSSTKPLGDTPAIHQSMLNNIRGDTNLRSAATYNVAGPDARGNMEAARAMAARAHGDLMRQVETA